MHMIFTIFHCTNIYVDNLFYLTLLISECYSSQTLHIELALFNSRLSYLCLSTAVIGLNCQGHILTRNDSDDRVQLEALRFFHIWYSLRRLALGVWFFWIRFLLLQFPFRKNIHEKFCLHRHHHWFRTSAMLMQLLNSFTFHLACLLRNMWLNSSFLS